MCPCKLIDMYIDMQHTYMDMWLELFMSTNIWLNMWVQYVHVTQHASSITPSSLLIALFNDAIFESNNFSG